MEEKIEENKEKNEIIQIFQNKNHENCFKNYSGSSSGMEAFLALNGVKNILNKYNMHVSEFIADGDSSSFKNISENVD